MERIDYAIDRLPYEAVIALGSCEPLKKWRKLQFRPDGDVYLIDYHWNVRGEDKRDKDDKGDKTEEHISVHKSGEIHRKIKRAGILVPGGESPPFKLNVEKLTEIQHGKTRLEEDYLYRWLPTLTERDKRQRKGRVIACLDEKLMNSLLTFSIAGLVSVENKQTEAVINSYLEGKESRSHAYVFHYGERYIVVCLEFSEGDMAIDKIKQQSVDSMSIPKKRLIQIEKLLLTEGFSVKGE